jgi:hypothetical protein
MISGPVRYFNLELYDTHGKTKVYLEENTFGWPLFFRRSF